MIHDFQRESLTLYCVKVVCLYRVSCSEQIAINSEEDDPRERL
jgi:hypothetical protein